MFGFSPLELVAIAVVGLGVFSVLGVVAFKIFEKMLEPKRWHADQVESGPRPSMEERELMGSGRGSFGDRLTAVERKLPTLKKPIPGDSVDRLLASLPDVDGIVPKPAARSELPSGVSATPPVATPPVATPPVATPPLAAPPLAPPPSQPELPRGGEDEEE